MHQECLIDWLSHSHKSSCELCKTPFRFTKLYDANMPETLPWGVFFRQAAWHAALGLARLGRYALVGVVWLVVLPWLVRWAWRWGVWIGDVRWAVEVWEKEVVRNGTIGSAGAKAGPVAFEIAKAFLARSEDQFDVNATITSKNGSLVEMTAMHFDLQSPDSGSLLSGIPYLAEATGKPGVDRVILDVFEGQLITAVVITGFILIFLIREWVVQQQPLFHLDDLQNAQAQLREAAEIVEQENARVRRQQDLLDQARQRLEELREGEYNDQDFRAWVDVAAALDDLRLVAAGGEWDSQAKAVLRRIRGAADAVTGEEVVKRVAEKLAEFNEEQREKLQVMLVRELQELQREDMASEEGLDDMPRRVEAWGDFADVGEASRRRPRMPERDFSSRATQIQRLLEEAEEVFTRQSSQDQAEANNRRGRAAENPLSGDERYEPEIRSTDLSYQVRPEEMPITNAGPDAKANIGTIWIGKHGAEVQPRKKRPIVVPEPEEESPEAAKKRREEDEAMKKLEEEIRAEDAAFATAADPVVARAEGNPFHPEGPEPEARLHDTRDTEESLGRELAMDLLCLDGPEQLDELLQPTPPNPLTTPADADVPTPPPAQKTILQRALDWFWADITVSTASSSPPPPVSAQSAPPTNEETDEERRLDPDADAEAPFVPVHQALPAPEPHPHPPAPAHGNPDILAAAAAAGLDPADAEAAAEAAEAVEDAEDLEGILELVGLQGPIIGLFQTSTFCTVLVIGTVGASVGFPYVIGKCVLNFLADPVWWGVKMPLVVVSNIADTLVDSSIVVLGGILVALGFAIARTVGQVPEWLLQRCWEVVLRSAVRLRNGFMTQEPVEQEMLGWHLAGLRWSANALGCLREIEAEMRAVGGWAGKGVMGFGEALSSGAVITTIRDRLLPLLRPSAIATAATDVFIHLDSTYAQPLVTALKTGTVPLPTASPLISTSPINPELVHWSATDRALALLTGYLLLALLATAYVAADIHFARSPSGRRIEKQVRDTFRQAGGVLKVILIISIEMLLFPFYCGCLLDIAFLPLFSGASVASRLVLAANSPWGFAFVHWFAGTGYMFHFALFVGMCRKILRRGVLWFIRDPDDPNFHPVRDVLERNVGTQLRKIAFSALVYGALVILCLGGVIWGIGRSVKGVFPVLWWTVQGGVEFPIDLFVYNLFVPVLVRVAKPGEKVGWIYGWWLRGVAKRLRLSHFLFGDRRKEEEGRPAKSTETGENFVRDGKYVLTPCNDQYRPLKPGEAFLHATDDGDVYIADKEGKKNDHFARIYVPPLFRVRVTAFMVSLWVFSAFTGLCATLLPLVFGRWLLSLTLPLGVRVNDVYAYTLGVFTLGSAAWTVWKRGAIATAVKDRTMHIDFRPALAVARGWLLRAMKCAYVYGYIGIVVPVAFSMVFQAYLLVPLHTWTDALSHTYANNGGNSTTLNNGTVASISDFNSTMVYNATLPLPGAAEATVPAKHTIFVLQDYCLGLLYARLVSRLIIMRPSSRAAELFRRMTARGYFNPDTWLATRFVVVPVTVLAIVAFVFPPTLAYAIVEALNIGGDSARVKALRYSYPLAASLMVGALGVRGIANGVSKWRKRIRDEVYLVGERLHNFGEKRPPEGSKSVIRRDR